MTLFPAFFIACAIGCAGAIPTPPPTTTTVPTFSMWVGRPSGPTRSRIDPPVSSIERSFVVFPTIWTTSSIHPSSALPSAIVSGIRSPSSATLSMMNCPALRFAAISGASIRIRKTSGVMNSFSMILFMADFKPLQVINYNRDNDSPPAAPAPGPGLESRLP